MPDKSRTKQTRFYVKAQLIFAWKAKIMVSKKY